MATCFLVLLPSAGRSVATGQVVAAAAPAIPAVCDRLPMVGRRYCEPGGSGGHDGWTGGRAECDCVRKWKSNSPDTDRRGDNDDDTASASPTDRPTGCGPHHLQLPRGEVGIRVKFADQAEQFEGRSQAEHRHATCLGSVKENKKRTVRRESVRTVQCLTTIDTAAASPSSSKVVEDRSDKRPSSVIRQTQLQCCRRF